IISASEKRLFSRLMMHRSGGEMTAAYGRSPEASSIADGARPWGRIGRDRKAEASPVNQLAPRTSERSSKMVLPPSGDLGDIRILNPMGCRTELTSGSETFRSGPTSYRFRRL